MRWSSRVSASATSVREVADSAAASVAVEKMDSRWVWTWAERRAEILSGFAGDEDGCGEDWEGDGERDAARRLGRVVRRMSGRMSFRMSLRMSGRMVGRSSLRPLVMASCHTSSATVAFDEVVECAPCDGGVARSVGEIERDRSSRSTRFGRGE